MEQWFLEMEQTREERLNRRLNVVRGSLAREFKWIADRIEHKIGELCLLSQIEMLEAILNEVIPVLNQVADRYFGRPPEPKP